MKLKTRVLMSAAAGIVGTGITSLSTATAKTDPVLAKPADNDAKLKTASTVKDGDGNLGDGVNKQMDQSAAKVVQANDGAANGGSELNKSPQADAKVTGADQAT